MLILCFILIWQHSPCTNGRTILNYDMGSKVRAFAGICVKEHNWEMSGLGPASKGCTRLYWLRIRSFTLSEEWMDTPTHTSIHGHPQREIQRQGDRETDREIPEILLYLKKCKTFTAFINTFWIVVLLPFFDILNYQPSPYH